MFQPIIRISLSPDSIDSIGSVGLTIAVGFGIVFGSGRCFSALRAASAESRSEKSYINSVLYRVQTF